MSVFSGASADDTDGRADLEATREFAEPAAEGKLAFRDLTFVVQSRIRHLIEVVEPLVLISQVQRCGGTLLSQLFDSHPQCHAHPHELKIGYPSKQKWPPLDLSAAPSTWFEMLREKFPVKDGYYKQSEALLREAPEESERFPFLFLPPLQWQVFKHCITAWQVDGDRDILNAYMTCYFNSWLDNHNLYTGPKKIITGFTPRLSMNPDDRAKFFTVYPDGKLLTMIRNPKAWFVSARKHAPRKYGNIGSAMGLWNRSAEAAIDAKAEYGDSVFVLSYEELVSETEGMMRRLAAYLGIDFHPILMEPTFNAFPIKADSSFPVAGHGVITEPLFRHEELSKEEQSAIEQHTDAIYKRALATLD